MNLESLAHDAFTILSEVVEMAELKKGQILVIGCSTSEVLGKQIGKAGSKEVASTIYEAVEKVRATHNIAVAFQCCEHLNRALVIERSTMEVYGLDEVSVVPVPSAGGSMAAHAYQAFRDPVVVEQIKAHAGVDIGDTMIGMHLRAVAVPLRPSIRQLGQAHVNAARTRPKLIGGSRAVYERSQPNISCT